jgi:hypothetical protein
MGTRDAVLAAHAPFDSTTWVVVGAGRSLPSVARTASRWALERTVVCNRAIELVPGAYWVWVDRFHYERSKWHPNARLSRVAFPRGARAQVPNGLEYVPSRSLPCKDDELFLSGGTLTAAAHLAVHLGARTVVLVACDAWLPGQDRYHVWDGKALEESERSAHEEHLRTTARGIRSLAQAYPSVQFLDATEGPLYLGLPRVLLCPPPRTKEKTSEVAMTKAKPKPSVSVIPDQQIPNGYGKLVAVTPMGAKESVLWFEDASGTVRALRMGFHTQDGLALELKGFAQIVRS